MTTTAANVPTLPPPSQSTPNKKRRMRRYRLLGGFHVQTHPTAKTTEVLADGRKVEVPARVTYQRGDVFETPLNLLRRMGPEKFQPVDMYTPLTDRPPDNIPSSIDDDPFESEYLDDDGPDELELRGGGPVPPSSPPVPASNPILETLESMSAKELVKFAAEEEIDIKGVNQNDKAALLKALKSAKR